SRPSPVWLIRSSRSTISPLASFCLSGYFMPPPAGMVLFARRFWMYEYCGCGAVDEPHARTKNACLPSFTSGNWVELTMPRAVTLKPHFVRDSAECVPALDQSAKSLGNTSSYSRRLPFFAQKPSEPFAQPASFINCSALLVLNSYSFSFPWSPDPIQSGTSWSLNPAMYFCALPESP